MTLNAHRLKGLRISKRERNLAIVEAKRAGRTLRDIAGEHGISAPRVRQIVMREEEYERAVTDPTLGAL